MHDCETKALIQELAALERTTASLHAWLQANAGAPTKRDLAEMEARLLKAIGERIDPKAVLELAKATGRLGEAVAANQPNISG